MSETFAETAERMSMRLAVVLAVIVSLVLFPVFLIAAIFTRGRDRYE